MESFIYSFTGTIVAIPFAVAIWRANLTADAQSAFLHASVEFWRRLAALQSARIALNRKQKAGKRQETSRKNRKE